jgi:hypothetical protein
MYLVLKSGISGSRRGIEGVGGVGGAMGTPEPKSTRPLPKKVRASLEFGFGLNLGNYQFHFTSFMCVPPQSA